MIEPDNDAKKDVKRFAVAAEHKGMRLDVFLTAVLAGDFSRSRIQSLIKAGRSASIIKSKPQPASAWLRAWPLI